MDEFGDLSGIVRNVRTGNLVGGHQRVKCFDASWEVKKTKASDGTGTVAVGYIETPRGRWVYREVDWDESKEKAANLAANKHGGEWDIPKLDVVLGELRAINFDMELTGFLSAGENKNERNEGESALGAVQYQIIVKCTDERQQISIIEELEERGLVCQPLIL
jgi:hypothetical protein